MNLFRVLSLIQRHSHVRLLTSNPSSIHPPDRPFRTPALDYTGLIVQSYFAAQVYVSQGNHSEVCRRSTRKHAALKKKKNTRRRGRSLVDIADIAREQAPSDGEFPRAWKKGARISG